MNMLEQKITLKSDWLTKHNPIIDWITKIIKFTRCSYDTGSLFNASCAQVWKTSIDKILKEFEKFIKLFNELEDDDALFK